MGVKVNLHLTLRRYTNGQEVVEVEGKTVGECLRNLVERLVIMVPGRVIQGKDIPLPYNQAIELKGEIESSLAVNSFKEAKSRFEKAFIESKLREFNGNISQTAEAIGIERSNLHKKIKAYGLEAFRPQ